MRCASPALCVLFALCLGSVITQITPGSGVRSPGARLGHAIAYAPPYEGVLLVAGALADRQAISDTWLFRDARWTRLETGSIPARIWPGMAWDAARAELVLFGGRAGPGEASSFDDTWVLRDSRWIRRDVEAPPARDHAHLAYDARRQRVVMFGGWNATTRRVLNDTWEWDGRRWTQMQVGGPSPRAAHGLAWDAARHVTVLFGGRALDVFHRDTWTWDGVRWRQVAAEGPAARAFQAMFFDPRRERIVLAGGIAPDPLGDAWMWNGHDWRPLGRAFPPRSMYAAAWDPRARAAFAHGGGQRTADGWVLHDETWQWKNDRWSEVSLAGHDLLPFIP